VAVPESFKVQKDKKWGKQMPKVSDISLKHTFALQEKANLVDKNFNSGTLFSQGKTFLSPTNPGKNYRISA
jgi:hypothetical protein